MKPRAIVRAVLLVFVVGSIAYLAVRGGGVVNDSDDLVLAVDGVEPEVVVFYFDGDIKCTLCENIDAYTLEAIKQFFADELASGTLSYRKHNTDRPQHAHYATEYKLYSKSVVLVRRENGEQVDWKNLEKIWDLSYDKPAFIEYIRVNTREFLDGAS